MGGQDTTEGETASTCRVGTTAWRAEELELAGQIVAGIPYYVTLPYGTEVCEADRIEVGGRTFEVMMVMRPTNETARQCICKEIR